MATARSITKNVSISRPPAEVFAFIADAANWPKWAVVNVQRIEPTEDPDWWLMQTPHGAAHLRIHADAERLLLDHDYRDAQAAWTVPARVVPNGTGSEFLITFFQPPGFADDYFESQIALVDKEMAALKDALESQ